MTKKTAEKLPPLEDGLLKAMQALDNQLARAIARTPAEREVHGVQKWEPIEERVERVSVFLLDSVGAGQSGVESLVILSQAFSKALVLLCEDLGGDGLGQIRSKYVLHASELLSKDAERLKIASSVQSSSSLC